MYHDIPSVKLSWIYFQMDLPLVAPTSTDPDLTITNPFWSDSLMKLSPSNTVCFVIGYRGYQLLFQLTRREIKTDDKNTFYYSIGDAVTPTHTSRAARQRREVIATPNYSTYTTSSEWRSISVSFQFQADAMVDLVVEFGWRRVSIVFTSEPYGNRIIAVFDMSRSVFDI